MAADLLSDERHILRQNVTFVRKQVGCHVSEQTAWARWRRGNVMIEMERMTMTTVRWKTLQSCTLAGVLALAAGSADRKSTRLNSSHSQISYAVFCLKKKKKRLNSSPATYSPVADQVGS